MALRIEQLIDPEAVALNKQGLAKDGYIDIFLNRPAGPVVVTGGEFGSQTIQAMAIDQESANYIESIIAELDRRLGADFRVVNSANLADISFYFDTEIVDGEDSGSTLGIALSNQAGSEVSWELVMNTPELIDDQSLLRYALIHEFGHALGLEHPFEDFDGDVYLSTDPYKSALPSETVLAYPADGYKNLPQTFTNTDWLALESIWGVNSGYKPDGVTETSAPRLVSGTTADDVLTGTGAAEILRGLDGHDEITAGGGADYLFGGTGANLFSSASDGQLDWLLVEVEQRVKPVRRGGVCINPPEYVDQIEAVGSEDRIAIVSSGRGPLKFRPVNVNNAVYGRLRGVGIYSGGLLEAVVTDPDLSLRQVRDITELMSPAAAASLV